MAPSQPPQPVAVLLAAAAVLDAQHHSGAQQIRRPRAAVFAAPLQLLGSDEGAPPPTAASPQLVGLVPPFLPVAERVTAPAL
eukprot:6179656-Pleurochrysis_carterae.AAC.1